MTVLSKNLENIASESLKNIGSRLTPIRKAILSVLENSDKPLSAVQIVDSNDELAQSTLYRNLAILEESKLVQRVVLDHDYTFFELSEHLLGHHHHLRCTNCGLVIDVELDHEKESSLEMLSKELENTKGFKNINHYIEFAGHCGKCSA